MGVFSGKPFFSRVEKNSFPGPLPRKDRMGARGIFWVNPFCDFIRLFFGGAWGGASFRLEKKGLPIKTSFPYISASGALTKRMTIWLPSGGAAVSNWLSAS